MERLSKREFKGLHEHLIKLQVGEADNLNKSN